MAYGKKYSYKNSGNEPQVPTPADPFWSFGMSGRKEPARSPCCHSVVWFIMRNDEDDYYCSGKDCLKHLTTRKHLKFEDQPVGIDRASGQ